MSLTHSPKATRAARVRWREVTVRLAVLNLFVSVWLVSILNVPFWQAVWKAVAGFQSGNVGFVLSLPVFVVLWIWLLLECLTWGRAAKSLLGAVLLLSAAAAYFVKTYGIVFDREMIANIAATDAAEALQLLSVRFFVWVAALGVLPVLLLSRVRIAREAWHMHLVSKATTVVILLVSIAAVVTPLFKSYASLLRNHRELRLQLVPTNYVGAVRSYVSSRAAAVERLEQVGSDAVRDTHGVPGRRPALVVLVLGETARAANFELDGYGRSTTPRLAAEPALFNFSNVYSCGTATALSLPCIFLDVGRAGYADGLASRRENLLDVLQRVGVAVSWRDNNSGCKGICDRTPHEEVTQTAPAELCPAGECYDEALLHGLQQRLDEAHADTLVVLHMKGSHGPAYYLRYPPSFAVFTPECRTNQLDQCERQSIIDAYDNTLRYTDHVLGLTIDLLRGQSGRFDTSLFYVSDHGESLGERGLYLHGMPYALAPDEQKHIPMVIWLSDSARRRYGIDEKCMRAKQTAALSHDNVYHSLLGLFGVRTRLYQRDLDILGACRSSQ